MTFTMFPLMILYGCPPLETLLRKQNLLPEKKKCFSVSSETFFTCQPRFLFRKHCFLVCPLEKQCCLVAQHVAVYADLCYKNLINTVRDCFSRNVFLFSHYREALRGNGVSLSAHQRNDVVLLPGTLVHILSWAVRTSVHQFTCSSRVSRKKFLV